MKFQKLVITVQILQLKLAEQTMQSLYSFGLPNTLQYTQDDRTS